MYVILWVDVVQTVSIVDEFKTMIFVDLTVEETSGSTLLDGGVQTLSIIDAFGNMIGWVLIVEDTIGPTIFVDGVACFNSWWI